MERRHLASALLTVLTCTGLFGQTSDRFLSNLSATRTSALYTTYAAAMERSEFVLDEGYHFLFYDSTRGADFVTDNAGDWSLGFRRGSKYVYTLSDMAREPVISLSYPDMVSYSYFPYDDIRVDATFLVHSSRMAVQDITVTNTSTQKTTVDLLPFLQNGYRAFNDVAFHKEKNAITFTHEEFPDGWVLDHKVPYAALVSDVLMFSRAPDRMSSFRSYQWGSVEISPRVDLEKAQVYNVWGTVTHPEGGRCRHHASVRIMAQVNDDKRRLLTESAPRWGNSDPNMSAYGVYGVELGNFGALKAGDSFTVTLLCGETGQEATVTGTVGDTSRDQDLRVNATLTDAALPAAPQNVRRDIWGSGTELRLYWKAGPDGLRYNVYRRDYGKDGVYELLGANVTQTFFTDKNIPEEKIYGYIVTAVNAEGRMSMHSNEVNNIEGSDFLTDVKYPGQVKGDARDLARVISATVRLEIPPGGSEHLRIVRGVRRPEEDQDRLLADAEKLLREDLSGYARANEELFRTVPPFEGTDPDLQMLYWSSFALMRQVMLPPEGKSSFNYYVFSREPQWGWGHGGQVFHESLTMLAYALMDPVSAMNSQRVYRERQYPDGYINYRTGSYLDETIPHEGQLTTSAPWYAWQNWEVYRISKDRKFLEEMYESSVAFYNYYVSNRDSDGDGLCEWGGHGVLECVRDGKVAVWDEVGWPSNFEAVDLNAMLVMEEKSLAAMAAELGKKGDAKEWAEKAAERSKKINATMWDEETGFYYNVSKSDHRFTFKKPNDLKREEIIGFLPLWAGIADSVQARKLVQKLTDPKKFWRQYGVPSLSADDSYYDPKGYWNGPVWVEWVYLIQWGLQKYGYQAEAKELVRRVASNMIAQLKKDHNLWEFYSPDDQWAGYHKTYIWAGLIARMIRDAGK